MNEQVGTPIPDQDGPPIGGPSGAPVREKSVTPVSEHSGETAREQSATPVSEQDEGLAEHSQPARAVPWRGITIILAVVSLALILLGIVFYFIQTRMDPAHAAYGFVTETWLLLDAGAEYTLPTWLASMLWGSLGIAAGVAARNARYRRVGWTMLAVVAFAASIDEYAQLHERLWAIGESLQVRLGWELWYTWVLPGMIIALVVAVLLLPLVLSLPARSKWMVFIGGAVFLGGAVGIELVGAYQVITDASIDTYVMVTMLEEFMELLGVSLAIGGVLYALHTIRAGKEKGPRIAGP